MKRILAWLSGHLYALCLVVLLVFLLPIVVGCFFVGETEGVSCNFFVIFLVTIIELMVLLRLRSYIQNISARRAKIISITASIISFLLLAIVSNILISRATWDLSDLESAAVRLASGERVNDDYLSIYTFQHVPLLFLTYLYGLSNIISIAPATIGCVFSAFLITLSFRFVYRSVDLISNRTNALTVLIALIANPLFYVYSHFYYTDIMALPIMCASLYVMLFLRFRSPSGIKKHLLFVLLGILAVLCFKVRAVASVFVVAFLITSFFKIVNLKSLLAFLCGSAVMFGTLKVTVSMMDIQTDDSLAFPLTHWVEMGLNEQSAGKFSSADYEITASESSYNDKIKKNIEVIGDRLSSMEPGKSLNFFLDKLKTTFSNGNYDYISSTNKVSRNIGKMHDWVIGNKRFVLIYVMQGWNCILFCLLLVAVIREFAQKRKKHAFLYLGALGAFVFYLFWEVQPRYGLCFVPIFSVLAFSGLDSVMPIRDYIIGKKRVRRVIKISLSLAGVLLLIWGGYYYACRKIDYRVDVVNTLSNGRSQGAVVLAENGDISQSFVLGLPANRIAIKKEKAEDSDGWIRVRLDDGKNEYLNRTISMARYKNRSVIEFVVPETLPANKKYSLHIWGTSNVKLLTIAKTKLDLYPDGDLEAVDADSTNDLQMYVSYLSKRSVMSLASYIVVSGLVVFAAWWGFGSKGSIGRKHAIMASNNSGGRKMRENFSVGSKVVGSRRPFLICLSRKLRKQNDTFRISGWCLVKIIRVSNPDYSKIGVRLGDVNLPLEMLFRKGLPIIKHFRLNHFEFSVTDEQLVRCDVQNRILLDYPEATAYGRIIYRAGDFFRGHGRHSRIIIAGGRAVYLRQTVNNTMYITQRLANDLDSKSGNMKLFAAWLLSKFCFWFHGNTLMYEKESCRFEESASVVFEKLMKRGAKKVYFILDKDASNFESVKYKYGNNIIKKHSFRHFLYFFSARKFIGTETLGHALQLRCANRLVLHKLNSRKLEYVFLQHGVMYMISLDSDQRTGFYRQNFKKHKVIVSSKLEADHFVKYAGFNRRDLWVCGLPKFDKSTGNSDADKIVIMPTWRRWEANLAATDFTATEYYRMIHKIILKTPKNLRKNLIVMPHPLMLKALESASKNPLRKYLPEGEWSYDGVLKQCRLLITDYSSVAYDAFYRGANVVFYWGEKKYCMQQYGEKAHLMLTKKLAFGPVCKKYDELPEVIQAQYESGQARKYLNRYRRIVKYYDNKNTNRVVNKLIKEGMVK